MAAGGSLPTWSVSAWGPARPSKGRRRAAQRAMVCTRRRRGARPGCSTARAHATATHAPLHVGVTYARLPPSKVLRRSPARRAVMRIALVGAAAGVAARVVAACVIWDPPTDDPAPIHYHPLIETASVVRPTRSNVLNEPPSTFTVLLEIVDPTPSFLLRGLRLRSARLAQFAGSSRDRPRGEPHLRRARERPDGGIAVHFTIDPTLVDPSVCHVIQFNVALGLSQTSLHTPTRTAPTRSRAVRLRGRTADA